MFPKPLTGLIICWQDSRKIPKAVIRTVMVYYKERIQIKIGQGRKCTGQKPGKSRVQSFCCLFPVGPWGCSLSVCVEQVEYCLRGKSAWASLLSLTEAPWLRRGCLGGWSRSPAAHGRNQGTSGQLMLCDPKPAPRITSLVCPHPKYCLLWLASRLYHTVRLPA